MTTRIADDFAAIQRRRDELREPIIIESRLHEEDLAVQLLPLPYPPPDPIFLDLMNWVQQVCGIVERG